MKDLRMLLRMVTIVTLAVAHVAESCNIMDIGELFTIEYSVENDDEDEEEIFERMSISDIRKVRKIDIK
jgi:hypothetical protein